MDESYLEWLSFLPGVGAEKARRIAERFSTFEHLRAATREELASVPGLTPADVEALEAFLRRPSGRDDSGHLFLCPECGSFAGAGATSCPVCGVAFAEEEAPELEERLDAFLEEEDRPAALCLTCGASMARGEMVCPVCRREYSAQEIALLPGIDSFVDEAAPFCQRCGAYLPEGVGECAICGRGPEPVEAHAENGHNGKGIVKSFLSRWQRVAEGPEVTAEDQLREELSNLDRLLEADASLEKVWAKRGRLLGELGKAREAAESFAKAAELNPGKEEDYRLEVLNILKASEDASFLPPRWREPAATAAPKAVDPRLLEALRHYDELLHLDPTVAVAWRTKGEILERLGRATEARTAFERADFLEGHEGHTLRAALEGLQTRGLLAAPATGTGRTNGRVNGRANGHVNGRGSGRVNGLTNGRVNGLTNGRVNGLTNGAVNGLTFGRGATNGLVNGNGFTNGRRGRQVPVQVPAEAHWARSVIGLAAVVALMVLAPILASYMTPVTQTPEAIAIDRDFGDWAAFAAYADSAGDQPGNPDVNLVSVKVASSEANLYAYARVEGLLFRGSGTNGTDSIFVFVDEDGNRATGYRVGDLGAEVVAEVTGWDGRIQETRRLVYIGTGGVSDDWNRFRASGAVSAAASGSQMELRIPADRDPARARVLLYAADSRGDRDPSDADVQVARPSVVVAQRSVAPDVVTNLTSAVLQVNLAPLGGTPYVSAVNVTLAGTSPDAVSLALLQDDGNGVPDAADARLSIAPASGARASLSMGRALVSPTTLWVQASWSVMTPGTTFGVRVEGLASNGTATLRSPETGLSYLGVAPAQVRVDGAFGDWAGRTYGRDLLGDVVNRTGSVQYDANVDLLSTAVSASANFSAFVRVDGRILGGEDIPVSRARAPGFVPVDTDLDGVPDSVETNLANPELRRDFNNDNVTDAASGGDVDGDGIPDGPAGPDCWLNTTIPGWYPAPYAGRAVTRYVCFIAPTVQEGVDVVYAYIDADNSTATGLWSSLDGRPYGFDEVLSVVGRNGVILSKGLYAYTPGTTNPWRLVTSIDAGLDAQRMEIGVDAGLLNLSASYRVVFYASDWRLGYDIALPDVAVGTFGVRPMAPATTVVINEISPSPNPEWVELVNPTASSVSLAGWDLAMRRGNKMTVLFAFTSQVLGAWGSGSEYLAVSPPSNSLPNGNNQLVLRQNGVVVDTTTYTASVGGSNSWSRFKDPFTGVPMDSNNDAADFYVSLLPSRGRPNDRHGPVIAVAKTVSASVGTPGQLLTYTVYYNNTGTGLAKTVWVNDTLPAGVTYVSSSVAPTTVAGATYGWVFTNVQPTSTNVLTVTVQVNGVGADGSLQVNRATLAYVDQLRQPMAGSQAWANFTVARPTILVAKTVSPGNAGAGQTVTFTIYYNNTGSLPAATVTIRDSLPSGLNYTGSSLAPTWTDGRTFYWNLTNVAPGAHSLTLTALVTANASVTSLVNWAFLNYTTASGYVLNGGSASAVLAIPELTDFLFVLAVPFLVIGLRFFRTRREKEEGVADSVPRAGGR